MGQSELEVRLAWWMGRLAWRMGRLGRTSLLALLLRQSPGFHVLAFPLFRSLLGIWGLVCVGRRVLAWPLLRPRLCLRSGQLRYLWRIRVRSRTSCRASWPVGSDWVNPGA